MESRENTTVQDSGKLESTVQICFLYITQNLGIDDILLDWIVKVS